MAPFVHDFDWPDRFIVGTVGEPGSRVFYLQARAGERLMSVSVEKEQSAALAERIDEVLDDIMATSGNPFSVPAEAPEGLADTDPLEFPVHEHFRAGTMGLGWDQSTGQIVIEAFPIQYADAETLELLDTEPAEVLVVRIPVGAARAFAERSRQVVAAGRPRCPLCGEPLEDDHVCTLPDEFR